MKSESAAHKLLSASIHMYTCHNLLLTKVVNGLLALPTYRYTEDEIEQQVSVLRVSLSSEARPVDAFAKETHMLAEATELKKQQLRSAFGIRDDYVEGSAFDSEQQALRAAQARAEREEKAR